MNEQEIISHIEELGLSNKEAKVYVASLKTGPAAVQTIADRADIKRVTTYVILESLVGLGLVSQTVKGKKTYFIAEDPSNLSRLLDKRELELKDQKDNFHLVLPELLGLKTVPKETPKIKFYDSIESVKTIMYEYLVRSHHPDVKEVLAVSNLDELYRFYPELRGGANPQRKQTGIHSRFLYTSVEGPILKGTEEQNNRIARYMPIDVFPLSADFSIIADVIIMRTLSGSNPIGISIESRDLAQGLRGLFEAAWLAAEAYN